MKRYGHILYFLAVVFAVSMLYLAFSFVNVKVFKYAETIRESERRQVLLIILSQLRETGEVQIKGQNNTLILVPKANEVVDGAKQ